MQINASINQRTGHLSIEDRMRDLGLRREDKALGTPYCGLSILRGGLMRKMETNLSVGPVMIGQAGNVLKRVDLD